MQPSQNLHLPPRFYPPFQQIYMCDPPRIYHPPPLFNKFTCATLPESTTPSQNIPSFSTPICDPPRIYSSLLEYTPFSTPICDPPRIYPSLPEYTPLFNTYMRPSQNLPLPSRIYPPFQHLYATLPESTPPPQKITLSSTTVILCDVPKIYPSFPEYTPPPFQQLYATLPESTHPSRNIPPPFSTTKCDISRIYPSVIEYAPLSGTICIYERIYHSLPELENILGGSGRFWDGRI